MKPDEPAGQVIDESDARESYEAPRLEVEELFEVLALACGKIQPGHFNCHRVSRAS